MTEQLSNSSKTLAFTDKELDYLQQFLDAHDRAGFYIAYNAMVSSESAILDADFGKFEASLQSKVQAVSS
jgi:hypothetical protein